MKTIRLLIFAFCLSLLSCSVALRPLEEPTIIKKESIEKYKYLLISQTPDLHSSTGSVYVGNYGGYGSTTSKSVNPSDVIAGILLRQGFIRIPELKPELNDETLIVNYGESGRKNRGAGYTIEVTIQFISAKSYTPVCSCTAEGQGQTEADDIRLAITRCLNGLLSNGNNENKSTSH